MKPKEIEKYYDKVVKKKTPGLSKGFKYVRIVDYDLKERTSWGKGTVVLKENPYKKDDEYIKYAISQIEIIDEEE